MLVSRLLAVGVIVVALVTLLWLPVMAIVAVLWLWGR